MRVQPEQFGSNGVSQYELVKFISVNEVTPTTLSGGLCRLLFEGDNGFENPIKGASCKIKKEGSRVHAVVGATSNIPDLETFKAAQKELGGKSTWTTVDWQRNMSETNGRMGCTMRMEEPLPKILRRELFSCSKCSARFIKWTIRKFLLSTNSSCPITLEEIWTHSADSSTDDEITFDEWTDFWKIMKLDGDLLEKAIKQNQKRHVAEGLKSYRLDAGDYEAFIKFQKYVKESKDPIGILRGLEASECTPVDGEPSPKNTLQADPEKRFVSPTVSAQSSDNVLQKPIRKSSENVSMECELNQ